MRNMKCYLCGKPRDIGRRICTSCRTIQARKNAAQHYLLYGHTQYEHECLACSCTFTTMNKKSVLCPQCLQESKRHNHTSYTIATIKSGRFIFQHRVITEECLGRRLSYNEVVHHVDCVRTNNKLSNLWVLSRAAHGRLHNDLSKIRIILEKRYPEELLQWKHFLPKLSKKLLRQNGEKFIKLSHMKNQ